MLPIGDNVKHIYREHTQEADHMANLGAEALSRATLEQQEIERCGKQWMRHCRSSRQSNISVPLRVSTAMAAEVPAPELQMTLQQHCDDEHMMTNGENLTKCA